MWKNFYSAWMERIGVNMPAEALPSWGMYVSGLTDDLALQALERITEIYFYDRQRNGTTKPPTLWQFQKAFREIYADRVKPEQKTACPVCDGEGVVMVLDTVPGEEWPPDPSHALMRRCICAAPCPECARERYTDGRLRERVRRFCRSNRRRYELMEVAR